MKVSVDYAGSGYGLSGVFLWTIFTNLLEYIKNLSIYLPPERQLISQGHYPLQIYERRC